MLTQKIVILSKANDDDNLLFNVPHVEPLNNTTQASMVVSTLHATVETTSSSDDSLARKPCSCLLPAVTVASVNYQHDNQIMSNTDHSPNGTVVVKV